MQARPQLTDSRGKLRNVLVFLLVSAVLSVVMTYVRDEPGMTLVYRTAADRFLRGEQFYVPDDSMAFAYPPCFVLPYAPLTFLPESAARTVWYGMNFCLLGALVWITLRMLQPTIRQGVEQRGPPPHHQQDDRDDEHHRHHQIPLQAAQAGLHVLALIEHAREPEPRG